MTTSKTAATSASKVWFVTGSSSGFGRSIVEDALAHGDSVVATARNVDALSDLVRRYPDRILIEKLDVTKNDEVKRAVASALGRFGRIDVLVNNAGFSIIGAVEETNESELRATMELMFFAAVSLTCEVVPHMRERKTGTIVQITSVGGIGTSPGFGAYCAAKHALEGLSECLSQELAPHGVRVLIVEPGAFRTKLFGGAFREMPATDPYATTVGVTRAWVSQTDGKQAGDPAKAARAIFDTVHGEDIPLRLPLGPDAVDAIRTKLATVARDVDRSESVARAAVFS